MAAARRHGELRLLGRRGHGRMQRRSDRDDLAIGPGSEHQAFVVRIDASIRSTSKDSLLDDRS